MKNAYIIFLALISVLVCSVCSMAETGQSDVLTMNDFIKTAEQDKTVKNQKEINDYLENAPGSTPYLNGIEFRTKTDEFDADKQKYGLRFYPKGWDETKYSRMVSEAAKISTLTEYDASVNSALKVRYKLILAYLETVDLIGLNKRMTTVCEDRSTILKKKSTSSLTFDMSDLIGAEELLTRLRLELVELENKKTDILHKISFAADSKAGVNFSQESLVRIDTIKKIVDETRNIKNPDNVSLRDRKSRVDLSMHKYSLEEAKSRDLISYFEVAYDHANSGDTEKAYSVEFGIKLPFVNPDQDEINRKKVSYMKERLEFEEARRELSEMMTSLTSSLDRLIRQYEIIELSQKHGNARESLDASLKLGGTDPLNILNIKDSLLKSEIRMVQSGYEIRNRLVELLDISGKLSEKPFRNYLAENQEAIR